MKLNEFAARMVEFYQWGGTIYLKSSPGRGKSTTIYEGVPRVAKALGKRLGLVIISAPLLTPADLVGYLVPRQVTLPDGRIRMESVFTEPFWFTTTEGKHLSEYDGGYIVVDEIDKADLDIKKVAGEMALSGRLGPHRLPEGWRVIMAGNTQKDRSGSTKELDHLINRRCEIEVTDDLASWEEWCFAHDVDPVIIAFGNQNPQIVFSQGVPEKQGPWCTPRSLVMCSTLLDAFRLPDGQLPTDGTALELAKGTIGESAAAQLFATIRLGQEMPKYEDILKDPEGCHVPTKPDAQMLVCYTLAARVEPKVAGAVLKYMQRMPKEFGITFAKMACHRNPQLIFAPDFEKWANKNSAVMAQLHDVKP